MSIEPQECHLMHWFKSWEDERVQEPCRTTLLIKLNREPDDNWREMFFSEIAERNPTLKKYCYCIKRAVVHLDCEPEEEEDVKNLAYDWIRQTNDAANKHR